MEPTEPIIPSTNSEECPVCRDGLDCEHFIGHKLDEDTIVSSTTVRLKCGHAYHATCLCTTFRNQDTACPTCRYNASGQEEESEDAEWILLETEMPSRYSIIRPLEGPVQKALETAIQSSSDIQKQRARVNTAIGKYRRKEQQLMKERRQCMVAALSIFREKRLTEFRRIRRQVKRDLRKLNDLQVHNVELQINDLDDESRKTLQWLSSMEACIGNDHGFGPLRKRFWYH